MIEHLCETAMMTRRQQHARRAADRRGSADDLPTEARDAALVVDGLQLLQQP